MSPTPEELMKHRDVIIAGLHNELTRLNVNFDELMKKSGFTAKDLENVDPSTLTPELRAEYEKAVEKAKREGAARATQAEADLCTSNASIPGMGRQGTVRL